MAGFEHSELQKLLADIERRQKINDEATKAEGAITLPKPVSYEEGLKMATETGRPIEMPDPDGISVPPDPFKSLGSILEKAKVRKEQAAQPAEAPVLEQTAPISREPNSMGEEPRQSLASILNFGKNDLASQQGLQDAQKRQNDIQFLANMHRASGQIGAGLAQSGRPDTSMADALDQQSKQPVEQYAQQIEFQKQDPNSSYSKGLKDYFKNKLGMEIQGDASAAELEKIMPLAVREYEAALERERKTDSETKDRQLKKELLTDKAETAKTVRDEKKQDTLSKDQNSFIERTSKQLEKHTTNLVTLRNAKSAIDAAVKNPSSIKDVGALYSFIKALDPGSVVREGEIELANKASGLFGGLTLKLSQLSSDPKLITPTNLKDIQDSITQLHDLSASEYDLRRQTAYKRAKSRNITEDRFGEFDPYADSAGQSNSDKKDPKVQKYADDHFSGDYEKAKALLEKRGYGQQK
jgi:hypothetical protein